MSISANQCQINIVKLGYNELGYNELSYNDHGYNERSVIANEYFSLKCSFTTQINLVITNML